MKDILDVLDWLSRDRRARRPVALATVVKTTGPAYRRPGARMLVADGRPVAGSVSGGCLEQDICERVPSLNGASVPLLVAYDSRREEELVWGPATGCGGVVWVLLEDLTGRASAGYLAVVESFMKRRETCVVATVVGGAGDAAPLGAHLVFGEDLKCAGECVVGESLLAAMRADVAAAIESGRTTLREYAADEDASADVEVLLEVIRPPVALVVFGGGHGASPLVRFAKQLGWTVTVVDHRPAYTDAGQFPDADRVLLARPEAALDAVTLDARTAAVIMTHNFNHDVALLRTLLPSPASYVGLLGARARTQKLFEALRGEDGYGPTGAERARLYAPAGLCIHSETPEEVALSIVSEIQAVMHGRRGGPLREQTRAIHDEGSAVSSP